MSKRKPEAWLFVERNGMATSRCKTKEQALALFLEYWDSENKVDAEYWSEYISVPRSYFTLDRVEQTRMYEHRACGTLNIGDPTCIECGEGCNGIGRTTFAIYFNND